MPALFGLFKSKAEKDAERLAKHQQAYVCGVCGAPSIGPLRVETRTPQYNAEGHVIGSVITGLDTVDWHTPRSLDTCFRCGKWACIPLLTGRDCLRGNVCRTCKPDP